MNARFKQTTQSEFGHRHERAPFQLPVEPPRGLALRHRVLVLIRTGKAPRV
jgi:hypothetical protein